MRWVFHTPSACGGVVDSFIDLQDKYLIDHLNKFISFGTYSFKNDSNIKTSSKSLEIVKITVAKMLASDNESVLFTFRFLHEYFNNSFPKDAK